MFFPAMPGPNDQSIENAILETSDTIQVRVYSLPSLAEPFASIFTISSKVIIVTVTT